MRLTKGDVQEDASGFEDTDHLMTDNDRDQKKPANDISHHTSSM
jgi:hypothetical protein